MTHSALDGVIRRVDNNAELRSGQAIVAYDDREKRQRIYRMTVTLEHFPALRSAKMLMIDGDSELHERFTLGQMANVFKLLDQCVADLRQVWNFTPEDVPSPTLLQRARTDLVSVFAGTTLSQTGQAIEIIGITMGVYLLISLVKSAIMSFYGWRISRSMGG